MKSKQSVHNTDLHIISKSATVPADINAEAAILAACLVEKSASSIAVQFLRGHNVFYLESHKVIWGLLIDLDSKNIPIDILTVYNESKKKGTKITIGDLTDLASRVSSSAHIEAHCMIIYELYMRRKAIEEANIIMTKAYDLKQDIFTTYDYTYNSLKMVDPSNIFDSNTLASDVVRGSKEPPRKRLCGELIREGEIALFFGDEGCGKSMFSFQLAKNVSEGKPMFAIDGFENDGKPVKSVIFDFELTRANLAERYHHEGTFENFNENLHRVALKEDSLDANLSSTRIIDSIISWIENNDPGFVVIDNITYISEEITDNAIAGRLMKKLKALTMSRFPLSVLIIGHTPKRDKTQPIESKHFAGGKAWSNFCTSQLAIVTSLKDPGIKYIKHLKSRSGLKLFDSDNVCEMEISFERGTAQFLHVGNGLETDHIRYMSNDEKNDQIDAMIEDLNDKGWSLRKISAELKRQFGETVSKTTVQRRLAALKSQRTADRAADNEDEN